MGFPPDVVEYACEITIFKCGKLEWRYLDGILRDLHKRDYIRWKKSAPKTSRPRPGGARRRDGAELVPAGPPPWRKNDAWMDAYLKEMDGQ